MLANAYRPRQSWTGRASNRSSLTCRRNAPHPVPQIGPAAPAQIADLVEAASHEEGEEIINAVGQDLELEADVFEELDTEHQLEFLSTRTDKDAGRLLATMEPDDAADLIADLDQDRRLSVLEAFRSRPRRRSGHCSATT